MKDACEYPGCAGGGVPGNENRIHGAVLCDYCTVDPLATGWAAQRQYERGEEECGCGFPHGSEQPHD